MFGRNPNANTDFNQFPQSNIPITYPNVYQHANVFNFQFNNTTFNNNYNQTQPTNTIQNQFNQPQQQMNNNTNRNIPDFDQFLNDAEQYTDNSLANSTKNTYNSNLIVYERIMNLFQREPYPISIDKIKVFLTYQAKDGQVTLNTLKSYITALSYYFRSNNLNNLILSNEFKSFKKGLLRSFKENASPYAKLAFIPEYFLRYLQVYDMNEIDNIKMMFYMSLSFYAFLRISELINLKKKDINYDAQLNKLIITIRFSKTDQTGNGFTSYLYNNNHKVYHPLNYISFISNLKDNDYIVNITEDHLRKKLAEVLKNIGLDPSKFSWHSFRRGGATIASLNHIDPSVIKTHGRWQSEAYLLYVDRDQDNAGLQISDIL